MKNSALLFSFVLVLAGGVTYGSWLAWRRHADLDQPAPQADSSMSLRGNLPPGKPLTPFQLTDQNGRPFDSASLKGKVWVASYFFASCPGPCFRLNQSLAGLQEESELKDVRFVSITCDPGDDSPDVLAQYAGRFNANANRWTFLTGDLQQIIHYGMGQFGVPIAEKTHSELAIVLDRNSTVRGYFNLTDAGEVNDLRHRLLQLLAEPEAKAPVPSAASSTPAATKG